MNKDEIKKDAVTAEKAHAEKVAFEALNTAERAFYNYATKCDVGYERTKAFNCFENIRRAFIDA